MVFTSLVSFNLSSFVKCCLETLNTVKSDHTIQISLISTEYFQSHLNETCYTCSIYIYEV